MATKVANFPDDKEELMRETQKYLHYQGIRALEQDGRLFVDDHNKQKAYEALVEFSKDDDGEDDRKL